MAEINYYTDIKKAAEDIPADKFVGSSVLVTGATGLIGSCLIGILMNVPGGGFDVYAAVRNPYKAEKSFSSYKNNEHFHIIEYDVTRPLTGDVEYDFIIHAAGYGNPGAFASCPVDVMLANILGTNNLLEYGRRHGVKRFVYVSSGEVYGRGDGKIFKEDDSGYVNSMVHRSCYPSSKRAAETLCVSYAAQYGVHVCVARPCHTYGPYFSEKDDRVYAQFIRNVINGEDIILKSSGEQFRSWCYVVDCAKAILFILFKGENLQAYNVADENSTVSIRELAEMIASISGQRVVFERPSDEEKKMFNTMAKSVYDTSRLHGLGWKIAGTLKEKMVKTIEAARERR